MGEMKTKHDTKLKATEEKYAHLETDKKRECVFGSSKETVEGTS